MHKFGSYIRKRREELAVGSREYSQRQLSKRIGIEPSYLSKIERGLPVSLSEEKILMLAQELDVDSDYLLALGGKISSDVQGIIKGRPELFSRLIREMKNLPDSAIEVESEFRGVMDALNDLHELASIGAFRLSDRLEDSYYTEQVASILELEQGALPTLEVLMAPFSREAKEFILEVDEKSAKTGEPVHFEQDFVSVTGVTKYVSVWGWTQIDPATGGRIRSGIVQDVTENTELRNEMQAAKQSLEIEVDKQANSTIEAIEALKTEVRQRKLLQEELSQLNSEVSKRAAVQNQSFKEIAFQIKTLSSSLILKTGIEAEGDPAMRKILSKLIHKVDSLGDLINADSTELRQVDFSVESLIRSAIKATAELKGDKGEPSINYSQAPDVPDLLRGDETKIHRLIESSIELLEQVTEWGIGQVSTRFDGNASALILRLYTPALSGVVTKEDFYPSDIESKTLKLANPARLIGPIVESLGGELGVSMPSSSELSIQMSIPAELAITSDERRASKVNVASERVVLVVEDDPYNLLFMEKGLISEGFTVDTAVNGKDALSLVHEKEYDLILLDIQLPDLSGVEVAESIRQKNGHDNQNTPIIAVTAHVASGDLKVFNSVGIVEAVSKPFDLSYLVARIGAVLEN